jgi:hypothetical protein
MNDESFRRILRAAFAMTMTSPFVATAASCGGSTTSTPDASGTSGGNSSPTGSATGTGTSGGTSGGSEVDAGKDGGGGCTPASLPPDQPPCSTFRQIPCDQRALVGDAGESHPKLCDLCKEDGGLSIGFCGVARDSADIPYVTCTPCVIGRRPEGFREVAATEGEELGRYFAEAAQLEAASVGAFLVLEGELRARGAPPDLLRRAARAAGDEVRHAREMAELALALGAAPGSWQETPVVEPPAARSDEAIAIENAIEGQVRETFGALVAMWQAAKAEDAGVAERMARVAEDETRHAALAWAVASFTDDRLDTAGRARVARARNEALAALKREIATSPSDRLVDRAGLPTAEDAGRLFAALEVVLWRALG